MKIEASEQGARAWLKLINEGLKAVGLDAAQAALLFQQRVQQAAEEDAQDSVSEQPD